MGSRGVVRSRGGHATYTILNVIIGTRPTADDKPPLYHREDDLAKRGR